ncbi:MAG: carbohydrate binding domain-containing protein [Patescibacteria group bacterium]
MNLRPKQKIILGVIVFICCGIFFQFCFWFVASKPANAQIGETALEAQLRSLREQGQENYRAFQEAVRRYEEKAQEEFGQRLKEGFIRTAAITLKNTLIYTIQQAGRQTMQYVATGQWGQGPMFWEQSFDYFKQTIVGAATQEMLDTLAYQLWSETGFDMCDPDVDVKLAIMYNLQLNLPNPQYELVAPRCDWRLVKNNWEGFYDEVRGQVKDAVGLTYAAMGAMQDSLDPKQNDFGIFLKALDQNFARQKEEYEAARDERLAPSKLKDQTSVVTGFVQTPSYVVETSVKSDWEAVLASRREELKTGEAVLAEIPETVLAAFIQSFGPQQFLVAFLNRVKSGLIKRSESYNPVQKVYEQKKSIEKVNTEVLTADFSFEPRSVSLIDEFVNCPSESNRNTPRGQNDCVLDRSFAEAVRRAALGEPLTLEQAIAQGLINDTLPFYGPQDKENNTPECYNRGFCYSNLQKLRKARIIPLGWEMAALKMAEEGRKTLREVINQFNNPNSPFYRLVDPGWILKEPSTVCRAEVYGPDVIGEGASSRSEVCSDYRSCVDELPSGECVGGYGYCAEEKRTWLLEGDSCDGQFAGCTNLYDRGGNQQSWVLNTLDSSGCDSSSVGCRQYSLWKDDGKVWTNSTLAEHSDSGYQRWIFLNKNIESLLCTPDNEGCTRFIRTAADLGSNLLINSGLEDADENGEIPGWQIMLDGGVTREIATSIDIVNSGAKSAYVQKDSAVSSIWQLTSDEISIVPKDYSRYYILSYYLYQTDQDIVAAGLQYKNYTGINTFNWADAVQVSSSYLDGIKNPDGSLNAASISTGIWQRHYVLVNLPPQTDDGRLIDRLRVAFNFGDGGSYYVDDLQIEEVFSPTTFALYAPYASTNADYLKQAPDYYNCYDEFPNNDAPECANFMPVCSAEAVGCERYTPTDGGAAQTAVVGRYNYCPAECVGYQSFSQSETFFEPLTFPVYFIPSTARTCEQENVGCETYTNLDVLAQGGEAINYFKQVKQCLKSDPESPHPDCATFYTWTGSGDSGYQITNYSLRDRDKDGQPDVTDPAKDAAECDADVYNFQLNPDCRQFYNQAGQISYHLISLTITCAEDCSPFRLEASYADLAAARAKCEPPIGNGTWDLTTNKCIYQIIPSEALTCPAAESGCREYKGNFSGDVEVLYQEDFEAGLGTWFDNASNKDISYSSESLNLGGHSMEIPSTVPAIYEPSADNSVPFSSGAQYSVSFWAKPDADLNTEDSSARLQVLLQTSYAGGGDSIPVGTLSYRGGDWNLYTATVNYTGPDAQLLRLTITNVYSAGDNSVYVDNIKISRVNQFQYLVKNSWSTPQICDTRLDGVDPLPQAMLGCREYSDRDGTLHYLRSFNNFCGDDVVGCEALIDTKNNREYQEKIYNPGIINVCEVPEIKSQQVTGGNCNLKMMTYFCNNSDVINNPTACINAGQESLEAFFSLLAGLIAGNNASEASLTALVCNALSIQEGYDYSWNVQLNACVKNNALDQFGVPADELVYRVVSEEMSCDADQKGCTAAGQAGFSYDQSIVEWYDTFFILDPDNLTGLLCSEASLGCEQFADSNKNIHFLKDPGLRYCEYRSDLAQAGWYEAGSEPPAPCKTWEPYQDGVKAVLPNYHPDYLLSNQDSTVLENTGWAASCPETQSACTAFIDPADKTSNYVGRTYYYKNNDKIDRDSCDGVVDPKEGCMLFQDTAAGEAKFSADATYFLNYLSDDPTAPFNLNNLSDSDLISLNDGTISKLTNNDYDWSYQSMRVLSPVSNISPKDEVEYSLLLNGGQQTISSVYQLISGDQDYRFTNDSNTVLKVKQDRQCSKWYSCLPSMAWDNANTQWVEVCELSILCDKYSRSGGSAYCSHAIVPGAESSTPLNENEYFTEAKYVDRQSTKFPFLNLYHDLYTPDYSGYAIYNQVPLQFLTAVDLADSYESLGQHFSLLAQFETAGACNTDADCASALSGQFIEAYGSAVQSTITKCISGACYGPKSLFENIGQPAADSFPDAKMCRAYPEQNSPLPFSAIYEVYPWAGKNEVKWQKYRNAEYPYIDSERDDKDQRAEIDYGCRYTNYSYGNNQITLHVPPGESVPPGICSITRQSCACGVVTGQNGAEYKDCSKGFNEAGEIVCDQSETCLERDKSITDIYGWEGYCLEDDYSVSLYNSESAHPCLTWYPADQAAGLTDRYNQYAQAGYQSGDFPYYCLTSRPYLQEKAYFSGGNGQGWLRWLVIPPSEKIQGECHMDQAGRWEFFNEILYRIIADETGFSGGNQASLGNIASSMDNLLSGKAKSYDTLSGNIDIEFPDIRSRYLQSMMAYYFSNKLLVIGENQLTGENNISKQSQADYALRTCGEGYFPVFSPCDDGNDDFAGLPGYGYKTTSPGLTIAAGVLCVPYGSVIEIPDSEIEKWRDKVPNIDMLQGAQCVPHFKLGDLLKKGSIKNSSTDQSCIAADGTWNNGACSPILTNYEIDVDTVYDYVVAQNKVVPVYSQTPQSSKVNVPTIFSGLLDMDDPYNYQPLDKAHPLTFFYLSKEDVNSGYYWGLCSNQSNNECSDNNFMPGDQRWQTVQAIQSNDEPSVIDMNFDFMTPLYRYCVKTPQVADEGNVNVDGLAQRGTNEEFAGDRQSVEYVENYLHEGSNEAPLVVDVALEDKYLNPAGQTFVSGEMLCDNVAEIEIVGEGGFEDKAWTNRMFNTSILKRNFAINSPDTFGFYYDTPPGAYGQVDVLRGNLGDYIKSDSCYYNEGGNSSYFSNNALYNPLVVTDFSAEDARYTYCPDIQDTTTLQYKNQEQIINSPKSYMKYSIEGASFGSTSSASTSYPMLSSALEKFENYSASELAAPGSQTDLHRLDEPFSRLSSLFAKVFNVYSWNPVENNFDFYRNFSYQDVSEDKDISYQTVVADGYRTVPVVAGVQTLASGKYQAVGDTITLKTLHESRTSGIVRGYDGQLLVQAQFFGWADKDHMPIRQVSIDWGDPNIFKPGPDGQYKNYKPICAVDRNESLDYCVEGIHDEQCRSIDDCSVGSSNCEGGGAPNFGSIPDACAQSYFQKPNFYICYEGGSNLAKPDGTIPICPAGYQTNPDLISGEFIDGCWDPGFESGIGACVFRPGAQIIDNWGWCNGDCFGAGNGCYEDQPSDAPSALNQCSEREAAFTRFNGVIIITP